MNTSEIKLRKLLGVGLGSSLEWYDFALYGFFAPIFAKQFFPVNENYINLLQAFSVFAIGFLVRPLGGLIFGIIGDKYGRTRCLRITPLLITIPTLCIAFLPNYAEIGFLAPLLLLISRIVQGIFIGGEYAGNMVYMCEANVQKRYFLGSLGSVSGSFGLFLASSAASLTYWVFPLAFVERYGWRIAFLLSLFLGIAAYILRRRIPETPDFETLKIQHKLSRRPIIDAIQQDWHSCLVALSFLCLHATTFYAIFTFMPSLISDKDAFVPGMALKYVSLLLFLRLFILPLMGILAGKLGGKNMMRVSSILFICSSYTLFSTVNRGEMPSAIIALSLFGLLSSINAGTIPGLLTEILPSRTRYTTFSFAFNMGFGVFGGISPFILQFMTKGTGDVSNASFYLIASAVIALLGTFFIKEYNDGSISEPTTTNLQLQPESGI